MDGHLFDEILRGLANSRRTLLATVLAAAGARTGISALDAKKKKKKKKCARKCKDGCCTGKYGTCIKPAQQNSAQCGTGGEICRTNCGGGACGAGCDTCCANGLCLDVEEISNQQCGTGGETCFACPAGQACNAPGEGCCAIHGAACGGNGVQCCDQLFTRCGLGNICCGDNTAACEVDSDCCQDTPQVCDQGRCSVPTLAPCQPGQLCQRDFICPGALSLFRCCAVNGHTCQATRDCCEDEDICDGGICKRHVGDFCDETIICRDRYPHCVNGACRRCLDGQISTGSDEICCPSDRYCPNANEGRGACCENVGCCLPDEDGVECGLSEHMGEGQCGSGEYPPEH